MKKENCILKPLFSTVQEVEDFARGLMKKYGLEDWNFKLLKRKGALGFCRPITKTIALCPNHVSSNLGKLNDRLVDTILHEIAHALNFVHNTGRGHGKEWKKWCEKLGANAKRCEQKPKFRIRLFDTNEVVGAVSS